MVGQNFFCSQASLTENEPLFGTAPYQQTWFLVEYNQMWREKAAKDNEIPPAVKAHLQQAMDQLPNARLLLIRQENSAPDGIRFYAVNSIPGQEAMYSIQLQDYEELTAINLVDLVQGKTDHPPVNEPLIAVCTHGKHDACCAKFGLPVYRELREKFGDVVWQSTHIGGRRFAATLLIFPQALNFGRLTADHAVPVIDAYLQGKIVLDHYRGRCGWTAEIQAAEYFIREKSRLNGISDLQFEALSPIDEATKLIRFTDQSQTPIDARVRKISDAYRLKTSCTAETESSVVTYERID